MKYYVGTIVAIKWLFDNYDVKVKYVTSWCNSKDEFETRLNLFAMGFDGDWKVVSKTYIDDTENVKRGLVNDYNS